MTGTIIICPLAQENSMNTPKPPLVHPEMSKEIRIGEPFVVVVHIFPLHSWFQMVMRGKVLVLFNNIPPENRYSFSSSKPPSQSIKKEMSLKNNYSGYWEMYIWRIHYRIRDNNKMELEKETMDLVVCSLATTPPYMISG